MLNLPCPTGSATIGGKKVNCAGKGIHLGPALGAVDGIGGAMFKSILAERRGMNGANDVVGGSCGC
jgi:hypothetical protein